MNEKTTALLTDVLRESRTHIHRINPYLVKRKITDEVQNRFQIGYLPDTKTIFSALKENWDAAEAIEIALNIKLLFEVSEEQSKYSSLLGGRLIFPIFDVYGRLIALAGRSLDNQKPKYFNTVFFKGRHLYGLNQAYSHIIELGYVIIVEGYMDVVSAHRIGVKNVVAVMGTALTKDHSTVISRYTKNCFLVLDNDKAGQASTEKYMEKNLPDPLIMQVFPKNISGSYGDIDEMVVKNPIGARNFLLDEITRVK